VLRHPAEAARGADELRRRCASCRLCGASVAPPAILWTRPHHRALIVGQAPGAAEREIALPFAGDAGRRLRQWLAPLGVEDHASFLERFAVAATLKCYPGPAPGGRGDRVPGRLELERCLPWTAAAVRVVDPLLVLPIGRLAIAQWLGEVRLADVVGRRFDGVRVPRLDAGRPRTVIPLPHPSGASAWVNLAENRERVAAAVALVGEVLAAAP
jgi:uracil-DNA glycosylase